ncbi:ChbG/HpnK family deacetylase [Pseudodesulfovibrio sp.]|uniref:ChbG/HpnK family deacetylase n=1 Tax=unclassified Pseudodesulfovibrio TaxID=2661612 RepID=UPI003B00497E
MGIRLHADDLGLSPGSDAIFFDCIENGNCRSVSLLPNGDNFEGAIQFLTRHPEVHVSVHFNLVEGKALAEQNDMENSGVDEQGNFNLGFVGLWIAALRSPAKTIPWIMGELTAQAARVRKALGPNRPLSMDGHVHTHMLPPIFRLLPSLAAEYKIQSIRIPFEPLCPVVFLKNINNLGLAKNLLLNMLSIQRTSLRRRSACVIGVLNTGKMTEKSITRDLAKCRGMDPVEIILHPAYINGGPAFYSNPHRLIEAKLLNKISQNP